LAAIVASSEDAIISKDVNGVITSWNDGAQRIFGYTAEEVIGKPITVLIPTDRLDEEPGILERILRGSRIDHYETVRKRKDGSLIDISLTVSPVKNSQGRIIGASKVARDITDRKRAEDTKEFLLNEIKHRVRNTLGTVQAIARQTFRAASSGERDAFQARLQALAGAHDLLTLPSWAFANVNDVVEHALKPFRERNSERIEASGPEAELSANRALMLTMVLHELGTNAVKYGALSNSEGRVSVNWELPVGESDNLLKLYWRESNGPRVESPSRKGFGSTLIERALEGEGNAQLEFAASGVTCTVRLRNETPKADAARSNGGNSVEEMNDEAKPMPY
jgi:PAS domain S-box-containing protein